MRSFFLSTSCELAALHFMTDKFVTLVELAESPRHGTLRYKRKRRIEREEERGEKKEKENWTLGRENTV